MLHAALTLLAVWETEGESTVSGEPADINDGDAESSDKPRSWDDDSDSR